MSVKTSVRYCSDLIPRLLEIFEIFDIFKRRHAEQFCIRRRVLEPRNRPKKFQNWSLLCGIPLKIVVNFVYQNFENFLFRNWVWILPFRPIRTNFKPVKELNIYGHGEGETLWNKVSGKCLKRRKRNQGEIWSFSCDGKSIEVLFDYVSSRFNFHTKKCKVKPRDPWPANNRSEILKILLVQVLSGPRFENFSLSWSGPRSLKFFRLWSGMILEYSVLLPGPDQGRTARSRTNRLWSMDPWSSHLQHWSVAILIQLVLVFAAKIFKQSPKKNSISNVWVK